MDERDDEIREVMAQEGSRGKRGPRVAQSKTEKRERNRILKEFLSIPRYEDAVKAAIELGLQPGSERFEEALKAWRAYGAAGRHSS